MWGVALLIFLGLYFPLKLPIPGTMYFVPNVFGLCVAGIAFSYRRLLFPAYYMVLLILVLFLICNVFLTSSMATSVLEKSKSAALLILNVSIFFLLSRSTFMMQFRIHRARYFFLGVAIALCVYALLESRFAVFRHYSDLFRGWAYPQNVIYGDDARDVVLAGGIRPKVFASEPAHVAFVVSVMLLLFVSLVPKFWCLLVSALLYASAVIVIGSPFPIMFMPALYIVYVLAGGKRINFNLIMLGGMSALLSTLLLWIFNAEFLQDRFRLAIEGKEGSSYARVWRPIEFAAEGLRRSPLLGLGLGSEQELGNLLPNIEGADRRDNMSIQSPIFALPLFCGLLGVSLFVALLWISMQLPSFGKIMGMGVFCVLFFQGGNISSCLGWFIGGVLLAIINNPLRSVSALDLRVLNSVKTQWRKTT